MKKIFAALLVAGLASPALAQEPLNVQGGLPGAENFAFLKDTRWVSVIPFFGITASTSHRVPAFMDGEVVEVCAYHEGGFGGTVNPLHINVSISTRNSAATRAIARIPMSQGVQQACSQINGNGTFRDGDAIVVNVDGANTRTYVVLRSAN